MPCCRLMEGCAGRTHAAGTPLWMAPEMLRDERTTYGMAADVWSAGVVLRELVQRRPPYYDQPAARAAQLTKTRGAPPLDARAVPWSNRLVFFDRFVAPPHTQPSPFRDSAA
jgi:serine/threonine protein kinase